MKRLLPLLALIAFASVFANQQKVTISPGFFSGKDYLDMKNKARSKLFGCINPLTL